LLNQFTHKLTQITIKNTMKNRKTKPENSGLEGRLNPCFGFEKVRVTLVFGFNQTRVANHTSSLTKNFNPAPNLSTPKG